jgi:hypothetical protein
LEKGGKKKTNAVQNKKKKRFKNCPSSSLSSLYDFPNLNYE